MSQGAFAGLVGISQPAVSNLVQRGVLSADGTGLEWLHAYCAHIREQAAGRAARGDLDLATERAGLAREQRKLTEIKRRQAERDLAPVALMTSALASASSQVAAKLDALPGKIKRACVDLPAGVLDVVQEEIAKARNAAADITVDLGEYDVDDFDGEDDSKSDNGRARAA